MEVSGEVDGLILLYNSAQISAALVDRNKQKIRSTFKYSGFLLAYGSTCAATNPPIPKQPTATKWVGFRCLHFAYNLRWRQLTLMEVSGEVDGLILLYNSAQISAALVDRNKQKIRSTFKYSGFLLAYGSTCVATNPPIPKQPTATKWIRFRCLHFDYILRWRQLTLMGVSGEVDRVRWDVPSLWSYLTTGTERTNVRWRIMVSCWHQYLHELWTIS